MQEVQVLQNKLLDTNNISTTETSILINKDTVAKSTSVAIMLSSQQAGVFIIKSLKIMYFFKIILSEF
jgi:hypothetical protein